MFPFFDIGNRYAHLYLNGSVKNISHKELFENFSDRKIYYINVKHSIKSDLKKRKLWVDLEPFVNIKGTYKGMGIDRKVLLLSRGNGIYIDAGSAITIDMYCDGEYQGGTILPGIWSIKKSYAQISPLLEIESLSSVNLSVLPNSSTQETLSYGIIAPIVALIQKINSDNLPIYCCGGDGELLAHYLEFAEYDNKLVFQGMYKVMKECKC